LFYSGSTIASLLFFIRRIDQSSTLLSRVLPSRLAWMLVRGDFGFGLAHHDVTFFLQLAHLLLLEGTVLGFGTGAGIFADFVLFLLVLWFVGPLFTFPVVATTLASPFLVVLPLTMVTVLPMLVSLARFLVLFMLTWMTVLALVVCSVWLGFFLCVFHLLYLFSFGNDFDRSGRRCRSDLWGFFLLLTDGDGHLLDLSVLYYFNNLDLLGFTLFVDCLLIGHHLIPMNFNLWLQVGQLRCLLKVVSFTFDGALCMISCERSESLLEFPIICKLFEIFCQRSNCLFQVFTVRSLQFPPNLCNPFVLLEMSKPLEDNDSSG
jgi:hypothetical protein